MSSVRVKFPSGLSDHSKFLHQLLYHVTGGYKFAINIFLKIMASRGEIGWQSEKTLSECMRYMLDNEIATDVCFEVGPPGGTTVNLRAHEYMLISRSPVFEAMFNSGMSECKMTAEKRIRINDIDADIFKLLLT